MLHTLYDHIGFTNNSIQIYKNVHQAYYFNQFWQYIERQYIEDQVLLLTTCRYMYLDLQK